MGQRAEGKVGIRGRGEGGVGSKGECNRQRNRGERREGRRQEGDGDGNMGREEVRGQGQRRMWAGAKRGGVDGKRGRWGEDKRGREAE